MAKITKLDKHSCMTIQLAMEKLFKGSKELQELGVSVKFGNGRFDPTTGKLDSKIVISLDSVDSGKAEWDNFVDQLGERFGFKKEHFGAEVVLKNGNKLHRGKISGANMKKIKNIITVTVGSGDDAKTFICPMKTIVPKLGIKLSKEKMEMLEMFYS